MSWPDLNLIDTSKGLHASSSTHAVFAFYEVGQIEVVVSSLHHAYDQIDCAKSEHNKLESVKGIHMRSVNHRVVHYLHFGLERKLQSLQRAFNEGCLDGDGWCLPPHVASHSNDRCRREG